MEATSNSVFGLCPYTEVGKLSPDVWSKIAPENRSYNDYFLLQGDLSFRYYTIPILVYVFMNVCVLIIKIFSIYRKTELGYGMLLESAYQEAVCHSLSKDKLVYLQIYFRSPRAPVFTKSSRVTLAGHLSNLGLLVCQKYSMCFFDIFTLNSAFLGGLLGLFTGMSVLSWAEAIHYICQYIIDKIKRR